MYSSAKEDAVIKDGVLEDSLGKDVERETTYVMIQKKNYCRGFPIGLDLSSYLETWMAKWFDNRN
jgi:hypothetical protein